MNDPRAVSAPALPVANQSRHSLASWALASLLLAMLLSSLGTSIANVALPTLAQAFAASFQQVQWIVLAFLLVVTTLVVSIGRLADMVGRRRLLLAGVTLFTVASLLCSVAPSIGLLIAARAVQGLGAAVMMALTMAFVSEIVPREKIGRAMGVIGTMSAIGTALGPSLGGLLIARFGWPSIFLINLPLGALTLALASRFLPRDRSAAQADSVAFDHRGTLLLVAVLLAYAFAMTTGRGSFGLINLALLILAMIGVRLFLFVEGNARSPLVRLGMLRNPTLSAGLAMNMLVTTVVMATLVVGPFHLADALLLDAAGVGLVMSSGPLIAALAGVPTGQLVDRIGAHRTSTAGLFAMLAGSAGLAQVPVAFGAAGYITPLVFITAGYAVFQAANNTAVMTGIRPDERGVVSGLLNLSRNLGLITGVSVMGAVFALATAATDTAASRVQAVTAGMHTTFLVCAGLVILALIIANVGRMIRLQAVATRP